MTLSSNEQSELKDAKTLLESSDFTGKLFDAFGSTLEKGLEYLPKGLEKKVLSLSELALQKALDLALHTLKNDGKYKQKSSDTFHKLCVAASGSVGGAFGLSILALELPITTTLMLRSIADIARSEGENLEDIEPRLACLEVFALGGRQIIDDNLETGYYIIRAGLSNAILNASRYLAQTSVIDDAAPILVKLISRIASRFGLVVSEKMAVTVLPIIGAAGGALVNTIFMDHYQDIARGHFIVRRLERKHGEQIVKQTYEIL